MSEQRQPGYYWVKIDGEWQIVECRDNWRFTGDEAEWWERDGTIRYSDDYWDEIGSRITPSMRFTLNAIHRGGYD